MRASRIDFAGPSFLRSVLQTGPLAWLLLAAGLAACGAAGFSAYALLQEEHAREAEIARLSRWRQTLARPAAPRAEPIAAQQAKAVNDIVARLNLPWSEVFASIESATPATIALLELRPDPERHAVRGTAEARSSDDMLAYIAKLGQQPFFSSVLLSKHEVNEQDPNKPLRFQFVAEWERNRK